MMDGPVSRSGRRLCAHINYPLPLIDCQTLCVWKPPIGPDVNNCRKSSCVVRERTGQQSQTHIIWMYQIYVRGHFLKKGHFHFLLQLVFVAFKDLIMHSCCIPLKQEMRASWVRTTVMWVMALLSSRSHKVQFRGEINWIWFQGSPSPAGRFILKQPDSPRKIFNPTLTWVYIMVHTFFLHLHFCTCSILWAVAIRYCQKGLVPRGVNDMFKNEVKFK